LEDVAVQLLQLVLDPVGLPGGSHRLQPSAHLRLDLIETLRVKDVVAEGAED
jgi:hypothetical protein